MTRTISFFNFWPGILTALRTLANVGYWALLLVVYLHVGPSFSVSPFWRDREEPHGFWSHTCFLLFRRRQGSWLEIASTRQPASRRYCQWTAWSYFGLTQCTTFAIYPRVSFPSTVFIYTHTAIAPCVAMSIILNAMAFVVVSKMQELIPISGKVYRDDSSGPENSVIPGLFLPGKETEGGRWSSKRQLTKASPQRLSGFVKRIKMF